MKNYRFLGFFVGASGSRDPVSSVKLPNSPMKITVLRGFLRGDCGAPGARVSASREVGRNPP